MCGVSQRSTASVAVTAAIAQRNPLVVFVFHFVCRGKTPGRGGIFVCREIISKGGWLYSCSILFVEERPPEGEGFLFVERSSVKEDGCIRVPFCL